MVEKIKENAIIFTRVLAVLLVLGLWIGTYFLLKGEPDRGTLGDMFGTVNALYSGLAFVAIIVTIFMQQKQLENQKEELVLTRMEFHAQNKTMRLQRFENTFFNLLKHLDLTINHFVLEITPDDTAHAIVHGDIPLSEATVFKGRNVFHADYHELIRDVRIQDISYEDYFLKRKKDYGHYFSLLESILELINSLSLIHI